MNRDAVKRIEGRLVIRSAERNRRDVVSTITERRHEVSEQYLKPTHIRWEASGAHEDPHSELSSRSRRRSEPIDGSFNGFGRGGEGELLSHDRSSVLDERRGHARLVAPPFELNTEISRWLR